MSDTLELNVELVNRLDELGRLAGIVDGFGATHRLPEEIVYALNLALDEIVSNVIKYGFDDVREHRIAVRLQLQDGLLRAEVKDDGRSFNPLEVPPPNLDAPIEQRGVGGLGIYIVRSMMDLVEYRHEVGHNVLTLAKGLQ